MIYLGKIEDSSSDPFKLTRYKVRVIGIHQANKAELPTEDLPWATAIQPNSAAMSGIGQSANGYLNGSTVAVMFLDEDKQIPFILGAIAGISTQQTISGNELYAAVESELAIIPRPVPPKEQTAEYIGPLTLADVKALITKLGQLRKDDYKRYTPYGIGRYQHTNTELQAIGYLNGTTWTNLNNINSKDQYLNSPDIQTDAEEILLKSYYIALIQTQTITQYTPKEKVAGALLASHVNGIDGIYTLVHNNKNSENEANENVFQFYKEGYKVITGKYTEEIPTLSTINEPASDNTYYDGYHSKSKFDVKPIEISINNQGFIDPNRKYPLLTHQNEPDTPRLASGVKASQSILGLKEHMTVKNVPIALSSVSWNQSPQPYNAVYPYNHVYQSESGHVMEFDDTPGAERIHIAHKSGTFKETDNEGNTVDRTIGIRTVIVDKDELVYIKGSGHVTVDGDMSLKVARAMNVEISGDVNMKVAGNYTLDVGGKFTVNSNTFELNGTETSKLTSSMLLLDAPNIIRNPITGDIVFSGHSTAYDGLSTVASKWSPTIRIPAPLTRHELQGIEFEDTDISKILAGPVKKIEKKAEDKTPPALTPSSIKSIYELPPQITYNTRLSANFLVRDVSVGNIGSRFPFEGQHGLTAVEIASNLQCLCLNCLEPIREQFNDKGFKLNSAIRPAGNPYSSLTRISQHELGMAADISFSTIRGLPDARAHFFDIARWIKDNILFDQLLLEYRSGGSVWLHISYNEKYNRRNILTMNNDTVYDYGLVLLEEK